MIDGALARSGNAARTATVKTFLMCLTTEKIPDAGIVMSIVVDDPLLSFAIA